MRFLIEPLFSLEETEAICRTLQTASAHWRPGVETAGWHARIVKQNHQLDLNCEPHAQLEQIVKVQLLHHHLVQAAAFPRAVHSIRFSRSGVGEGYGRHVDNAWMSAGRSDLSFTLFLSDPNAYEGGDLVLDSPSGEERFRLQPGHAVVYPSTLLHCVEPVTAGERLVAVGWIESRIRHPDQRELLFELDTARRVLFARSGKDEVFDLISRSYSNLLRLWDS